MTEKQTFIINELSIQKTAGLAKGISGYRKLAPHINIIFGPNGSGKSSTATAIRQLIWRRPSEALVAAMQVDLGTDRWDLKLDGSRSLVQCNGLDAALVGLPAWEESGRYGLALHELIGANDRELAEQIIRESVGGYDLKKAGFELGYGSAVRTKGAPEYKQCEAMRLEADQIRRKQEELKAKESRLDALIKQRAEAQRAQQLIGWYTTVESWLNTKTAMQSVSEQLAAFPAILATLTGKEGEALTKLDEQLAELEQQRIKITGEVGSLALRIQALGLPKEGIDPVVLEELEQRLVQLREAERIVAETNVAVDAQFTKERATLNQLGIEAVGDWVGLPIADIIELDDLLDRLHRTLSEERSLRTMLDMVSQEMSEGRLPSSESLTRATTALNYWLGQSGQPVGSPSWLAPTLIGLAAVTGVAIYLTGPAGFSGLVILLLAWLLGRSKRDSLTVNREKDYLDTGLEPPTAWTREAVLDKMRQLSTQLKEVDWQLELRNKTAVYMQELKDLEPRLAKLDQERQAMAQRLQTLPDLPGQDLKNYAGMAVFLRRLAEWEKAHTARLVAEAALVAMIEQATAELGAINELFNRCQLSAKTDSTAVSSILRDLREKDRIWRDARNEAILLADKEVGISVRRGQLEGQRTAQYQQLAVEIGDLAEVKRLCGLLPGYQQLTQTRYTEERSLEQKERALQENELYSEMDPGIAALRHDTIQEQLRAQRTKAAGWEALNKEIIEIELHIRQARSGTSLEAALQKKDEALIGLGELFEQNLSAMTGQFMLDRLKKLSTEANRPAEFQRARELFGRITAGRYGLIMQEGPEPAFHAYDNLHNEGRSLSQLSTGTRIQLLLAVRLAFIEQQEQVYRVPVLADELLANSDSQRADAIIQALAEISREGRQVFYFTAQHEEVTRWRTFLQQYPELSHTVLELDGRSNEAHRLPVPADTVVSLRLQPMVVEPGISSHAEYGVLLGIEPFDVLVDDPSSLLLWYLVEDTYLLAGMLRSGPRHWGELKNFTDLGGTVPGWDLAAMKRAAEMIDLLEQFQRLYRQGRSKPIDSAVLRRSNAISDKFFETVNEKLVAAEGDPKRLLTALRGKEIRGFQSGNIETLEQFLLAEGYIDELNILSDAELTLRLQAVLSKLDMDADEAQRFLMRFRVIL